MVINKLNNKTIIRVISKLKECSDDNQLFQLGYGCKQDEYSLPFVHKLTLKFKGKMIHSWGNGVDKNQAAFKAVAEMLERISFFISTSTEPEYRSFSLFSKKNPVEKLKNKYTLARNWIGQTTSGIALHSNLITAKRLALNEAIERHVILKAIALQISPFTTTSSLLESQYKIPNVIATKYFYWEGPWNRKVVILQIAVKGVGHLYAFGCSTSLEQAKEKAFLESIGMMIYAYENYSDILTRKQKFNSFNLKQILNSTKIDMNTIQEYHLLYDDNDITNLFKCRNDKIDHSILREHIPKSDIYWTRMSLPETFKEINLIYIVKVISPRLQPLFFGKWKIELINPLAIPIYSKKLPKGLHVIS